MKSEGVLKTEGWKFYAMIALQVIKSITVTIWERLAPNKKLEEPIRHEYDDEE